MGLPRMEGDDEGSSPSAMNICFAPLLRVWRADTAQHLDLAALHGRWETGRRNFPEQLLSAILSRRLRLVR